MPQAPGLPLLLPAYARVDLAYEQDFPLADFNVGLAGLATLWTGIGDLLDVPMLLTFTLQTSATPGTRSVLLRQVTAASLALWSVPAAVTQPESTQFVYSWSVLLAAAIGPAGSATSAAPIPPTAIGPGDRLQALLTGQHVGDTLVSAVLRVARYPTGPRRETTTTPAVATPVLA